METPYTASGLSPARSTRTRARPMASRASSAISVLAPIRATETTSPAETPKVPTTTVRAEGVIAT